MPRQIIKIKRLSFLIFSLVFLFLFQYYFQAKAESLENEETETYININTDTIWRKSDNLAFNKSIYVNPGATLTIEKGADIKFGEDVNGDATFLSVTGGRVVATGTEKEPIKITALPSQYPYFLVEFNYNLWEGIPAAEPSFFRFVEISGGGYLNDTTPEETFNFIPSAYAFDEGEPALKFSGGKLHMENCRFYGNKYADVGVEYWEDDENGGSYLEIVNSNFSKNEDSLAVKSNMYCKQTGLDCMKRIFLKNNWYDDSDGPSGNEYGGVGGKTITGPTYIEGWRKNDLIADPVIVIPGILGSAPVHLIVGKLSLDPIMHTYDNLTASFRKNGYEKDKTLFEFPYEWRRNNETTAMHLQSMVEGIVINTKISKVDVVAHSMGGLVTRAFIEETEGAQYKDNIDQLVTLGTPHKGSPKSYLIWEAGEGFFERSEKIAKKYFELEAHHAGYDNLREYIRHEVTSVGKLLPDYSYLYDVSEGEMRSYPSGYPRNSFIEDLNSVSGLDKFKKVRFTNIIGNVPNKENTITGYRIVDSSQWEHGMPENFYDPTTDRGIENGKGDETVPLFSAGGIEADKEIEINSTHGDLPTVAQCEIIKELTGKAECDYVSTFERVTNILTFGVFSPIDIQVVSPSGKWAGKNISGLSESNQIPGAFYSGYDSENEFLTIPNPEDGEYKIVTEGTGNGEYKVEAAKISEDSTTNEAKESAIEIVGTAQTGQKEEKTLEIIEDEIKLPEGKDVTPPEIMINSPLENQKFLNNQTVEVNFTVSDDKSDPEKIISQIYLDELRLENNKINLALSRLGEHGVKIVAADEAGNSTEKEIVFKVETEIDAMIANVKTYISWKLIKSRPTGMVLEMNFRRIKLMFSVLEQVKNSRYPNARVKNIMIRNLEREINRQIDFSEIMVKIQTRQKNISQNVAEILLEDLNFIRPK